MGTLTAYFLYKLPFSVTGLVNKNIQQVVRTRTTSESQNLVYAEQETDELIAMLRETESLDEQGDILQYLVDTHGLDFSNGMYFTGRGSV